MYGKASSTLTAESHVLCILFSVLRRASAT